MFMGIPPGPVIPNPVGWPNKRPCPGNPPATMGLGACIVVRGVGLSVVVGFVVTTSDPAPPVVAVGALVPPVPVVVSAPAPPAVVAVVVAVVVDAVAARIGPKVVVTTFVAVLRVGVELVPGVMAVAPGAVTPPDCEACVGGNPASVFTVVPGAGTLDLVVGVCVVVVRPAEAEIWARVISQSSQC